MNRREDRGGLEDPVVVLIRHAIGLAERHDLRVQLGHPSFTASDSGSDLARVVSQAVPTGSRHPDLHLPLGEWARHEPVAMRFCRRVVGSADETVCIAAVNASSVDAIDQAVTDGLARWGPDRVEPDPRSEWSQRRHDAARARRDHADAERQLEPDFEGDLDRRWWGVYVWDDDHPRHVLDDSPYLPESIGDEWPDGDAADVHLDTGPFDAAAADSVATAVDHQRREIAADNLLVRRSDVPMLAARRRLATAVLQPPPAHDRIGHSATNIGSRPPGTGRSGAARSPRRTSGGRSL